jgi:hypothetical protein
VNTKYRRIKRRKTKKGNNKTGNTGKKGEQINQQKKFENNGQQLSEMCIQNFNRKSNMSHAVRTENKST